MFDHDHYVPVLRWKGAERQAVLNLGADIKDRITPLIELVPKHLEKMPIEDAVTQIAKSWGGWNRLAFVDFNLLPEASMEGAIPRFAKRASVYQMKLALTTGLTRGAPYQKGIQEGLAKGGFDLCLRIHPHDFRSGGIERLIEATIRKFGIDFSTVHLILDFQSIHGDPPNLLEWSRRIPAPTSWRSFTLLAGAFPKDLSEFEKNSQHLMQRMDFLCWAEYMASSKGRTGSFGDYTVQHGVYEEHEGKQRNFSASLRYASNADWVIMRGEGVFNEDGPGFYQWPANAELLCEREEYSGENFSWGDSYIKKMSLQGFKTGTAKDWLAATINHHITLTARQIVELSAAADKSEPFLESAPSPRPLPAAHRRQSDSSK